MTTPTHTHTHTHLNELYWPSEEEEEAKFHLERVNSIVMMEFSHIFLSLFIKAIKLAPLPSQNAFCSYYLSYTFFGHPSSILASAQSSIVCVSVPLESGCECVCGGRGRGRLSECAREQINWVMADDDVMLLLFSALLYSAA